MGQLLARSFCVVMAQVLHVMYVGVCVSVHVCLHMCVSAWFACAYVHVASGHMGVQFAQQLLMLIVYISHFV